MLRPPGFRILPMVFAAVVLFAVIGSLVHVLCDDEEARFGEPSEAAASIGFGLCVLSVTFFADKVRRAVRGVAATTRRRDGHHLGASVRF